jgi:hypothetical protein
MLHEMAKPRAIFLLRKSVQNAEEAIPVLNRADLPLRFHFRGREIEIEVTPKGNLTIRESRLA